VAPPHAWSRAYMRQSTPYVGVALASSPTGPFTLVALWRPMGEPCGDLTAFVDPASGSGWLVYSRKWEGHGTAPRVIRICAMDGSFTNLTGFASTIWDSLEAPALMYEPAVARYFLWTSDATGFAPNAAKVFSAPTLGGPWGLEGNPTGSPISFDSQVTSVLALPAVDAFGAPRRAFVYIADRWHHANMATDRESGRYVWLPIFGTRGDGPLRVEWHSAWTLNLLGVRLVAPRPPPTLPSPPLLRPLPPPLQPLPLPPPPVCTRMAFIRRGFCLSGFYAGWDAAEATMQACIALCASEPQCRFAALRPGLSCSRYDERAGACDEGGDELHMLYGRVVRPCAPPPPSTLQPIQCEQFLHDNTAVPRDGYCDVCEACSGYCPRCA
jgi:hypothetical protein